MSLDQLKKLSIALGVLVVAWLGIEIIRDDPGDGFTMFEIPDVTESSVDSVLFVRAVDRVRLARNPNGRWTVNGFRADSATVAGMFEDLLDDIKAELVAENSASHGRFTIGEDEARSVEIFQGGEAVVHLLVGKRGRDFQSVYLRWPGDDAVYVARTELGTFVDRPINDWRDKRIATVAADSVGQVEVTNARGTYLLARADSGQWSLDGESADSAAVVRLLNQFGSINASGFPSEAQMDSVDLSNPDRRLVLRNRSNQLLWELAFDSTAASGYWVRRNGDSTIFRLDRFRVDQLVPADSTLRTGT